MGEQQTKFATSPGCMGEQQTKFATSHFNEAPEPRYNSMVFVGKPTVFSVF
jgi:hypothetical protein